MQVCKTPCMLRDEDGILKTVREPLDGLNLGEANMDGKFTTANFECLGACSNASIYMEDNNDFYLHIPPLPRSNPT